MVSNQFDPVKDITSQVGKVIFVTGGAIVFEPESGGWSEADGSIKELPDWDRDLSRP